MKLKLSKKQTDSIRTAMVKEQQAQSAFNIARQQAAEAANHRVTLLEVVLEAHGIDPEKVAGQSINLSPDGSLTFGENGNASQRIKKELQRGAVKRATANKTSK